MLSNEIERKFIESYDISDYEIWTDSGWEDVTEAHLTTEYQIYILTLSDGTVLKCADTHIVFDECMNEVFVKDLCVGDTIITEHGNISVQSVIASDEYENMYDFSVDSTEHRYYTNGVLSHNTTTCVSYMLWLTLFHNDKKIAVLANKAELARDILANYKSSYEALPKWLQQGVRVWNKGRIILENGSSITAAATTSNAIRGSSFNCVILDEFAFVSNNIADEFMASVLPTISSSEEAQIIIISTPRGMNHYYKIWNDAKNKANSYIPFEAHWSEVPGRDENWAREQLQLLGQVKYEQEVECRFLGSTNTLIEGRTLQNMKYKAPVEKRKIFNNQYLEIFEHPKSGGDGKLDVETGRIYMDANYVACVDVAEGLGLDYSVITIIDVTTLPYKVVAKYRSNTIQPILLPAVIVEVCKYYNNAWCLIEINQQPQVAETVYKDFHYDKMIKVTNTGNGLNQYMTLDIDKKTRYGIKTSHTTKRMGCNALKDLIESGKLIHYDFELYQEFTTFIRINNSFGADDGYHDDIVMSLVLFGWMTTQEKFKDITNHDLRKQFQKDELRYIETEKKEIPNPNNKIPPSFVEKAFVADNMLWLLDSGDTGYDSQYSDFLGEFLF